MSARMGGGKAAWRHESSQASLQLTKSIAGRPPLMTSHLVDLTDLIHFRFSLLQQARLQLNSHHISLALP